MVWEFPKFWIEINFKVGSRPGPDLSISWQGNDEIDSNFWNNNFLVSSFVTTMQANGSCLLQLNSSATTKREFWSKIQTWWRISTVFVSSDRDKSVWRAGEENMVLVLLLFRPQIHAHKCNWPSIRWMCVIWCLVLNKHLYLRGEWLSVDLRMNVKIEKRLDYLLKFYLPFWTW